MFYLLFFVLYSNIFIYINLFNMYNIIIKYGFNSKANSFEVSKWRKKDY
jgi:hypothetical protein